MERETKTIKVGKYDIEIIAYLTWGEKEDLQEILIRGAQLDNTGLKSFDAGVMREAKYKLMEIAIKGIKLDGKEIVFSREWINGLSVEDGDNLSEQLDGLNKKKQ
jgi:hypothetical protein